MLKKYIVGLQPSQFMHLHVSQLAQLAKEESDIVFP